VGIGKLYRLRDGELVANVNYQLLHHQATASWSGELTLVDNVRLDERDRFIIELEDKRKGECHLKKIVNRAVSGIPPRWIYHVTGTRPFE